MTKYTALLALPDGDTARDAASRLDWAETVTVTDDPDAGVWLTWTVSADNDQEGIALLQEIRLRAEMHLDHHPQPSENGPFSLFQATPVVILRGAAVVIHSEEVYCI